MVEMKEPRKMRILCLHGYNNTCEIMMFQMQNFINTMSDLCEFTFIEGIRNAPDPPIKYFVERGITPPFKSWMSTKYLPFRGLPDGSQEVAISKTQANYENVIESVYFVLDFINRQDEPFDGIAGFSQGVYQMQAMFKCQQYFGKKLGLKHRMPYFAIDFNGPKWDWITYDFLRSSFISGDVFIAGCESLHFTSKKDPMAIYLRNFLNFERPTVIKHTQGHRPVRTLSKQNLRVMADFFARQYEKKNGLAADEPHVQAALEAFYQSLKTSSMLPWTSQPLPDQKRDNNSEAARPKL